MTTLSLLLPFLLYLSFSPLALGVEILLAYNLLTCQMAAATIARFVSIFIFGDRVDLNFTYSRDSIRIRVNHRRAVAVERSWEIDL